MSAQKPRHPELCPERLLFDVRNGTWLVETIRASGHVRRANRPNTRLLLTKCHARKRTCKKGAIHTGQNGPQQVYCEGPLQVELDLQRKIPCAVFRRALRKWCERNFGGIPRFWHFQSQLPRGTRSDTQSTKASALLSGLNLGNAICVHKLE